MLHWFLEQYIGGKNTLRRISIDRFPFTVGRSDSMCLPLDSTSVSRAHGEFILRNDDLILRDLNSANGIFVNHKQITAEQLVRHGDILHFANVEFRLIGEDTGDLPDLEATVYGITDLTRSMPTGLLELQELLAGSMVTAEFEPIVFSQNQAIMAYEILGRGSHPKLSHRPLPLFHIAESANREVELSELFRLRGVEIAGKMKKRIPFFINTHPRELGDLDRLVASLHFLRNKFPSPSLVLEIHEESVTNIQSIKLLRGHLNQLNMQLAYDDFGSGQARLLELVEAPPDYIKFDISLIRDIHTASAIHIHMINALLGICRECGITTLAEGIDTQEKFDTCRTLGFELMQGYYFNGSHR